MKGGLIPDFKDPTVLKKCMTTASDNIIQQFKCSSPMNSGNYGINFKNTQITANATNCFLNNDFQLDNCENSQPTIDKDIPIKNYLLNHY